MNLLVGFCGTAGSQAFIGSMSLIHSLQIQSKHEFIMFVASFFDRLWHLGCFTSVQIVHFNLGLFFGIRFSHLLQIFLRFDMFKSYGPLIDDNIMIEKCLLSQISIQIARRMSTLILLSLLKLLPSLAHSGM